MALPWQEDKQQFREAGSYRFTEDQRKAYALYLDIRIVSFVHQRYESLKSNPSNGFWGYTTVFYGAVPDRKVGQEFVSQRIIRVIGRDNLTVAAVAQTHKANLFSIQSLGQALGKVLILQDEQPPTVLGFPETVVKFKSLPLSQFEFSCYWLEYEPYVEAGINFESEDPTDGDDEYPEPTQNDPANPYQGNPPASLPNPDSDPRDFDPANSENNFPRTVYFGIRLGLSTGAGAPNNCIENAVTFQNVTVENFGPPPYTMQFGYIGGSPCSGAGQGSRIVAADGSMSQDFSQFATTLSAVINVFQFTPFT